jgi:hypothetical protein
MLSRQAIVFLLYILKLSILLYNYICAGLADYELGLSGDFPLRKPKFSSVQTFISTSSVYL